jgi:hypothetical protein
MPRPLWLAYLATLAAIPVVAAILAGIHPLAFYAQAIGAGLSVSKAIGG